MKRFVPYEPEPIEVGKKYRLRGPYRKGEIVTVTAMPHVRGSLKDLRDIHAADADGKKSYYWSSDLIPLDNEEGDAA